jgi:phospholipid/cholesterol/gamma-HCH transport system substrate-binding protein
MRRIALTVAVALAAVVFAVIAAGAGNDANASGSYKIELDNAFGLVTGADFEVAGVRAGTIRSISLDQNTLHAVVTVNVTQGGFGAFHSDAFCQSRPQSLIGEYFIECQPGDKGRVLPPGSTIPVSHTQSTIPADLLLNIMRMPQRERLALIINELGAAAAGRSGDIQSALRRAVPALTQTDNLLGLLARDSKTLQRLTVSADTVITALANNSRQVQRFITEANNTATVAAGQQSNLQSTLRQLPGFLEQLRPAMVQLGAAATANQPVVANLDASATELNRLFTELPKFSHSAIPAIKSLGKASVTGKAAVQAAGPTVRALKSFAQPTPELAQNLAIVLHDLDDRGRAVEADSRSPGGRGYTGLEALLQYVFNQTLAINTFGPFGHLLAVDAFVDPKCSPYATPATIALSLRQFGPSYRRCYAWLGPNQPGVNETDPSNPGACVPDPGGAPSGESGPRTTACRLTAAAVAAADRSRRATTREPAHLTARTPVRATSPPPSAAPPPTPADASSTSSPPAQGRSPSLGSARQLLQYLLDP